MGALILGALLGCGGEKFPPPDHTFYGRTGVSETVTRAEALAIADAYWRHRWFAGSANILHGSDGAGVRVDTPDEGFSAPGIRPGWWKAGEWNVGVPYQWGGFSSLEELDAGVRRGLAAGDVYTEAKRAELEAAVSAEAVGIDCSGFISRCWKLSRPISTRALPGICDELGSYEDLRPGDILNLHNAHVLLFAGWEDAEKTRMVEYEAGSPPTWKVLKNTITVERLQGLGYQPYRYKGMVD